MIKEGMVFDLYVPLRDNAGRPIAKKNLATLKKTLLDRFGGFTHFPLKGEGQWKVSGHSFRDRIVILRVIADRSRKTEAWFRSLKRSLMKTYAQSEFLITSSSVRTL